MAKVKIGIIGGTGLDNPDIIEHRKENVISTPYGIAEVVTGSISGVECVSCAQHVINCERHASINFVSGFARSTWKISFIVTEQRQLPCEHSRFEDSRLQPCHRHHRHWQLETRNRTRRHCRS